MGGETVTMKKPKSTYPVQAVKPVGKLISSIYKERINQFYSGGQYEKMNLLA